MAVSGRKFNRADAFANVVMHEALERMTPPVRRAYAEIVRTSSVSDGKRLTRVTNREIARAVRMTDRFAEKAVALLRTAGLIEITERDRTQTRHPRCIRIVDADRDTPFVRIPESHPVWSVRPTAFWVWVTLRRCSSPRDHRTEAKNTTIAKRGGLTRKQVRNGFSELERSGLITKLIEGSNRRTVVVPIELHGGTEPEGTLPTEHGGMRYRTTGRAGTEPHGAPPTERDGAPNKSKNLLYLEPNTQSRNSAHPQPPTGAVVGSVLTDGPTSRPHKPEPEPRTPDDPFEGWPERCRVWWVDLRIQKNPRSVKREWIESGFLQYAFEDVRAKTEVDRTAIKNPAAYVASMLDDAGFEAFRVQRQRDERRESIERPEPQTTEAPERIDQAAELEPHESGLAVRLPEPDRKPELPDTVRYLVDRISPAAMQWTWQKVALQGIDPNDWRILETLRKVHGSGTRPGSYKYFEPIFNDLPVERMAQPANGYPGNYAKPRESIELIKARAELATARQLLPLGEITPSEVERYENQYAEALRKQAEQEPREYRHAKPRESMELMKARAGLATARRLFPLGECTAEALERYERRVAEELRKEAEREGREYHDTQRAESIEFMKARAVIGTGLGRIRTEDDLQRYKRRVAELEAKAGLDPLPVEPREARPEPKIAEVAMDRAEAREAARLREAESREARIQAETERRVKQWRGKEYSGHGDSRGTLHDRCDWVRATEPEKRREIESRVRAEYQVDRGDWPTGRSDPGRNDQAPGTRRTGAMVCNQ